MLTSILEKGNRPTHILTKHVKDIVNRDNSVTWIEENSSLIEFVITHDILNLSFS